MAIPRDRMRSLPARRPEGPLHDTTSSLVVPGTARQFPRPGPPRRRGRSAWRCRRASGAHSGNSESATRVRSRCGDREVLDVWSIAVARSTASTLPPPVKGEWPRRLSGPEGDRRWYSLRRLSSGFGMPSRVRFIRTPVGGLPSRRASSSSGIVPSSASSSASARSRTCRSGRGAPTAGHGAGHDLFLRPPGDWGLMCEKMRITEKRKGSHISMTKKEKSLTFSLTRNGSEIYFHPKPR
jgi:hypothetical protein